MKAPEASGKTSQMKLPGTAKAHEGDHGGAAKTASAIERPESHQTEKSESGLEDPK